MTETPITRQGALKPVLVASHPRSGTHVVMDLIRRQFPSTRNWRCFGLPLDHLYLNLERLGAEQRRFDEQTAKRIVNRPKRALLKTHFTADFQSGWAQDECTPPQGHWRSLGQAAKVIYVVRHPMDVMVSYHQFLSAIDASVVEMDLMRFLHSPHWDKSVDRLGWWQSHVSGWATREDVTVLRYEDVVHQTEQTLETLSTSLDDAGRRRKPLLPPKVTTLRNARLNRLLSVSPQSTAIIADRSRFPAIDWRDALTPADIDELQTRLNEELGHYGYSLDPAKAKTERSG
ncbi:sulfotransferase domain-containing protein [Planktotalea sp.]|uniref:sulfotransferase domain-containing protein n=1 Tax=Planktotalea sp. TaxID=2029877 RepID=UPI003298B9F4